MTTPDPPTAPLCEDPTCPAYGQRHGPDHDACVEAADDIDAAQLRRLLADLGSSDDRVRFAAATQLSATLPGWLPRLLDDLDALGSRIVTVDLDGRTVRYDRVAECDAALDLTEQQLEAAERDRDAAQAAAYRLTLERDNAGEAHDRLVDAVLDHAGPEWRPDVPGAQAGENIAVRYVRHLEAAVAQILPPLTTAGVARLLGLSRPRVVQLRAQPGFPPPDDIRDGRHLWHEHTIRRWAASVGRTVADTPDCSTTVTSDDDGEPQDTAGTSQFPTTEAVMADLAAIETGQVTDPDAIRTSVGIARLSLAGWRSAWLTCAGPYLHPDDTDDVPGSGPPEAAAGDPVPGMPHTPPGCRTGPQEAVQGLSRAVTYEGRLDVHQPPDGDPYPVLRLTGGLGGTVVYAPDAVVWVTSELHRDGDLLVRQHPADPT